MEYLYHISISKADFEGMVRKKTEKLEENPKSFSKFCNIYTNEHIRQYENQFNTVHSYLK